VQSEAKPPGVGKTHLAVALGLKAIEHSYGVYFMRAHDLLEDLCRALFKSMVMTITFVNRLSVLLGFLAIVGTGIAERFPKLRFAFVEAGAEWVPGWWG
jgi:hypothetical protein